MEITTMEMRTMKRNDVGWEQKDKAEEDEGKKCRKEKDGADNVERGERGYR